MYITPESIYTSSDHYAPTKSQTLAITGQALVIQRTEHKNCASLYVCVSVSSLLGLLLTQFADTGKGVDLHNCNLRIGHQLPHPCRSKANCFFRKGSVHVFLNLIKGDSKLMTSNIKIVMKKTPLLIAVKSVLGTLGVTSIWA